MGVIPIIILCPTFDLDTFVRDLDLDTDFFDNLLVQVPPGKVERVLNKI